MTEPAQTAAITSTESDPQRIRDFQPRYRKMWDELHKVIVGQDAVLEQLLTVLFAGGHALIIGVPGLAKTLMVKTLASTLGWDFKRIQFTPDLMPSDITGTEILQTDVTTGERRLHFVRGPVFANLILADEINRTPPKTQAALLEAMQEYTVTAAGLTHHLATPFFVVATQNPIEQEGTYPLPEAQLDRFMFNIRIGYPGKEEEMRVVEETTQRRAPAVERVFSRDEIVALQDLARRIPVSRHVMEYAVNLVRATRPNEAGAVEYVRRYVEWGAGPRASQSLIASAKVRAMLKGEPAPSCDDVRAVVQAVLSHRVIPNYNATGEGIQAADIVKHLLAVVPEPAYVKD